MQIKIIERYIGFTILSSMLVVLVVLLALFTFFGFLEQMEDVGQGNYTVLEAAYYVLLTIPTLTTQLFPMMALMGVTIGLGVLSSNSELIAIRSAGVSVRQIVNAVFKVGVLVIVFVVIVGEWVSPKTEQHAQMIKSVAISEQLSLEGEQGLWARDGHDVINVQRILNGGELGDIYIYTLGLNQSIDKMQFAKSAIYVKDRWQLRELTTTYFAKDSTRTQYDEISDWDTQISPDLLSVVTVKSNTQSTYDLYQYINYLEQNGQTADSYRQALWSKVAMPLVTGVMILLAIPFVFGPLRSVGIGHRILVGVLVGVGFHLLNQMFSYLGLVFTFNPAVSALLPTLIAFVVAVTLLRRIY